MSGCLDKMKPIWGGRPKEWMLSEVYCVYTQSLFWHAHTHTHTHTQVHMCACQAVWENVLQGRNPIEKYQLLPHSTRSSVEAVSNFQPVSMQFESSVWRPRSWILSKCSLKEGRNEREKETFLVSSFFQAGSQIF